VRTDPPRCWQNRHWEAGREWVASTFSVAALPSDINESARRILRLVAAARSYSQMDPAPLQRIGVTDGRGAPW
jgi:hypothetical protein